MKKIILFLGLLCLLSIPLSTNARSNVNYWYIRDYQVKMDINSNDTALITENIVADCGNATNKHGIFRVIPTKINTPEGTVYTPIKLKSITDFAGNAYKYQTTTNNGIITYKIGDPNLTVKGENNYRITYEVENIIRDQENNDELFFNILGNYFNLEIDNFQANIKFPTGINQDNTEVHLYSGKYGSQNNNFVQSSWLSNNVLKLTTTRSLTKQEGITISASFPKGYINHLNLSQDYLDTYYQGQNNLNFNFLKFSAWFMVLVILALSLIPALILLFSWLAYKRHNRKNPYHNISVVTQFSPPNDLGPLLLGMLYYKQNLQPKLITATIIKLATLKIIKIEETESKLAFFINKKINFHKLREIKADDNLDNIETYIFNNAFSQRKITTTKNLQKIFREKMMNVKKKAKKELKLQGYVKEKKSKLNITFLVLAIISMFTFMIPSAIIFFIFYYLTTNYTEKGNKAIWEIKGFKNYMTIAETERHKFYEQENIFTKLLPYSIVFSSVKLWLRKMKDIYGEEYIRQGLYWYAGASMLNLNGSIDQIGKSINSISSQINQSTGTSSGSGGSGFSGGGSGGGGGGGW